VLDESVVAASQNRIRLPVVADGNVDEFANIRRHHDACDEARIATDGPAPGPTPFRGCPMAPKITCGLDVGEHTAGAMYVWASRNPFARVSRHREQQASRAFGVLRHPAKLAQASPRPSR